MGQKPPTFELPPFQYLRALFALGPSQETKSSLPFQCTRLIGVTP